MNRGLRRFLWFGRRRSVLFGAPDAPPPGSATLSPSLSLVALSPLYPPFINIPAVRAPDNIAVAATPRGSHDDQQILHALPPLSLFCWLFLVLVWFFRRRRFVFSFYVAAALSLVSPPPRPRISSRDPFFRVTALRLIDPLILQTTHKKNNTPPPAPRHGAWACPCCCCRCRCCCLRARAVTAPAPAPAAAAAAAAAAACARAPRARPRTRARRTRGSAPCRAR